MPVVYKDAPVMNTITNVLTASSTTEEYGRTFARRAGLCRFYVDTLSGPIRMAKLSQLNELINHVSSCPPQPFDMQPSDRYRDAVQAVVDLEEELRGMVGFYY